MGYIKIELQCNVDNQSICKDYETQSYEIIGNINSELEKYGLDPINSALAIVNSSGAVILKLRTQDLDKYDSIGVFWINDRYEYRVLKALHSFVETYIRLKAGFTHCNSWFWEGFSLYISRSILDRLGFADRNIFNEYLGSDRASIDELFEWSEETPSIIYSGSEALDTQNLKALSLTLLKLMAPHFAGKDRKYYRTSFEIVKALIDRIARDDNRSLKEKLKEICNISKEDLKRIIGEQ